MRQRAEAYAATRERIVQATFEMHRAKGVAATTFSDVAARAGVAPATVIRHFPTMGDLVDACGVHVWRWLALPDSEEVFRDVRNPAERLQRLVEEVCGVYARGEEPLEGARRDRRAVPQLELMLQRVEAGVERLVRAALTPLESPEPTTQLALTLLDYGVWQSLRRRGLDEVAELTRLLGCVLENPDPSA